MPNKQGLIIPGDKDFSVGPEETNRIHDYSDVDINANSQHHTLGDGPNQAAPGSHNHGKLWLNHETGTKTLLASDNPGITKWLPSGWYDINGSTSMPDTGWWFILHIRHSNPNNNYARQMAFGFASNRTNYTRAIENNSAGGWGAMGF